MLVGRNFPALPTMGLAAVVGLAGYGISLVAFVVALRHLGSARTGAYFSTAPEHEHAHEAREHEHAHEHDAHHQHTHDFEWDGAEPHAHPHRHEPMVHSHPHYPDLHHRHRHG